MSKSRFAFVTGSVALGLVLLAAACSGSNDVMNDGAAGGVQIVLGASGTNALLAALPPEAIAAAERRGSIRATGNAEASGSQRVTAAEVQFSSILARNLDGELIPVTLDLPVTVDVFDLLDGGEYELPAGLLPPGDYDQIVVVMTALSLTVESGTRITIEPPGGGWTAIVATGPFSVVDGATTTIHLDLRWHDAIEWLGDHFEFNPIFDCDVDDPSGGGDDDSSGNGQGNGNGNRRG